MPRPRRLLATLALALAVVAFPLGALASHNFADVPDSNPFHNDISALVAAGVTSGCGGGNYCPSANVTREQMAAFMNRLGALAPGKTPVVNATKLDGLDSTDFLQADTIITSVYGPWDRTAPDSTTVLNPLTASLQLTRSGAGTAHLRTYPTVPMSIGDIPYGLSSVEVCFENNLFEATLDYLSVSSFNDAGGAGFSVSDDVDKVIGLANQCFSLAVTLDAPDGPVSFFMRVAFPGAGDVRVGRVTYTWAPIVP